MAREVLTHAEGLATGISYINKEDMMEYQVFDRVVILAASACESARSLLNSKSKAHPMAWQIIVMLQVNIYMTQR